MMRVKASCLKKRPIVFAFLAIAIALISIPLSIFASLDTLQSPYLENAVDIGSDPGIWVVAFPMLWIILATIFIAAVGSLSVLSVISSTWAAHGSR
jgi:hypothetical protein